MQKIFKFILFGFILIQIFSCQSPSEPALKNGFYVKGIFTNSPGGEISLQRFDGTTSTNIETVQIGTDGSFTLKAENAEHAIYRLQHGPQTVMLSYDGSEKVISIEGDAMKLAGGEYSLTGSNGSRLMQDYVQSLAKRRLNAGDIADPGEQEDYPIIHDFLVFKFIPLTEQTLQVHLDAVGTIRNKYPNHKQGLAHRNYVQSFEKNKKVPARDANSGSVVVGQPVPNITLPDPNGQIRKLSDLKGKVVVVDFWASWCGPCRRYGNPELVNLYNKYPKDKFAIMNVALERDKTNAKWKAAIQRDGLVWPYNVVDHDRQFAPVYGASKIPRTYLIDKQGKLAEINLHGEELVRAIEDLL